MPLDTQYRKDIVLIYILIYLHPPAVGVLPPYTQQFLSVMEAIHSNPVRLTFSFLVSQDTSCCQSSNEKNPRGFIADTSRSVESSHQIYIWGQEDQLLLYDLIQPELSLNPCQKNVYDPQPARRNTVCSLKPS